jgi:hypothetical protein
MDTLERKRQPILKDINKNAASLHLREKSWPAVVLSPIKLLSRPDLLPSAVPIRRVATTSQAIWGWCRWKSPVGSGDGDIQKQRPIPETLLKSARCSPLSGHSSHENRRI